MGYVRTWISSKVCRCTGFICRRGGGKGSPPGIILASSSYCVGQNGNDAVKIFFFLFFSHLERERTAESVCIHIL